MASAALADAVRLLAAPQNLAEEQEKAGAKEDCISFYSQAAELFAAEDSTSEASKCRQKARLRLRDPPLHGVRRPCERVAPPPSCFTCRGCLG